MMMAGKLCGGGVLGGVGSGEVAFEGYGGGL